MLSTVRPMRQKASDRLSANLSVKFYTDFMTLSTFPRTSRVIDFVPK